MFIRPVSQFGEWFTWCQSCRHGRQQFDHKLLILCHRLLSLFLSPGGHASHLLHWFTLHSDCPVTGCSCRLVFFLLIFTRTSNITATSSSSSSLKLWSFSGVLILMLSQKLEYDSTQISSYDIWLLFLMGEEFRFLKTRLDILG